MSIVLAKNYVSALDEAYKFSSLTSVLDGDDGLVKEGANAGEIMVPKMSLQGMATYSRSTGYVGGTVDVAWETVAADYERGRKFSVDVLDDEETRNVAFGKLAGQFIKQKVAPEIDAYRIAKIASTSSIGGTTGTLSSGANVVSALRAAISAMDDGEVPYEDRILFITPTLKGLVDDLDTTASRAVLDAFSQIIKVPQTRMYTKITLYDGTTSGQEAGGYIKDSTNGKDINFLAVHKDAVCQFHKHAAPKIIPPEMNADSDGYIYAYRLTSICRVYDNKLAGVYCHHKA